MRVGFRSSNFLKTTTQRAATTFESGDGDGGYFELDTAFSFGLGCNRRALPV